MDEKKKWWKSRTIWLNAIAFVSLVSMNQFGFEISPETQAAILLILNLILRAVTGTGLET